MVVGNTWWRRSAGEGVERKQKRLKESGKKCILSAWIRREPRRLGSCFACTSRPATKIFIVLENGCLLDSLMLNGGTAVRALSTKTLWRSFSLHPALYPVPSITFIKPLHARVCVYRWYIFESLNMRGLGRECWTLKVTLTYRKAPWSSVTWPYVWAAPLYPKARFSWPTVSLSLSLSLRSFSRTSSTLSLEVSPSHLFEDPQRGSPL